MEGRLKLKRVVIQGFKSVAFQHPLELKVGDVNVLMGANGAGKSNVVGFFQLLSYMMSGSLQAFVELAGTAQTFLYYGAKKTPALVGELHFENNQAEDIYRFTLSYAAPDRLIVTSEEVVWKRKGSTKSQQLEISTTFKESGLLEAKDKTSLVVKKVLANCKVYQFHDSSVEGVLRQASTVNGAHYLQARGNNLASFLYYLRESFPANYKRVVEYVRSVMPQFGDFYLQPRQGYVPLTWRDNSANDYVLIPQQFSDGTIRFIALATLLL